MFKSSTKSLLIMASLALPFSAYATEISAMKVPPTTKAIVNPAIATAHELLKTMNMDKTYAGMIERVTQMQLQQSPQLKVIEPTIHAFFNKYMGWDALKDDMAAIYAKNYTLKELEEIIVFYKTDVGQKTVQLMPQLAASGAQIGQNKLAQHMGELKEMVEAELKKLAESKK